MRFQLDGLTVFWPYDFVYREQHEYMLELKRALDARGDALLEMPTGTGKTISLLALITSYQHAHPDTGKLVYCTRTVGEMEKTMEEVKRVLAYRARSLAEERGEDGEAAGARALGAESDSLAVCLSTRRNLCVHPRVSAAGEREAVDASCRALTASWVREKARAGGEGEGGGVGVGVGGGGGGSGGGGGGGAAASCDFYEGWAAASAEADVRGVYDVEDLKALGRARGWCPYFFARQVIAQSQIVVYNYQ